MRAVLVIDMQEGMADRIRSGRLPVNPDAPDRVAALLAKARGQGVPVIHVHHDDPDPASPFRKDQPGGAAMACAVALLFGQYWLARAQEQGQRQPHAGCPGATGNTFAPSASAARAATSATSTSSSDSPA